MPLPTTTSKLARGLLPGLAIAAVALLLPWALAPWAAPTLTSFVSGAAAIVAMAALFGWLRPANPRAQRAERRLALAQDETGIGLFELDYRAATAYASPALCEILGQPVMSDGSMPLARWLAALDGGHVEDSRRTLQQKVASGELRYEREIRVVRPDGSPHWLLSRIRLDVDANGELATARGATLDITERKQLLTELESARSQLQQQLDDLGRLHALSNRLLAMPTLAGALEAVLRAVAWFHGTPSGILRLADPAGGPDVVVHCGLTPEALAQLAEFADGAGDDPISARVVASGQRLVVDTFEGDADPRFAVLRPFASAWGFQAAHSVPLIATGSSTVLGVLTVLMAEPGAPAERLWRLTDLCAVQVAALIEREQSATLARQAQQRQRQALEDADRRKDEFLATLAHELRNPLAPIRHAAAIVRDRQASEAQRQWSLAIVERQLQQMALLLDDLLDVSRITRGELTLRRSPSTLQAIAETALETSRPLLDSRHHTLVVDLPEEPLGLDVDPLRIAQVLGNLLVNAAKYTEPGGRVVLQARRDGGEVRIAVRDNGSGLRAEDREKVFDMFTRLPSTAGHTQGGLGIGLALARNLARLHGGRLDAESPGPGLGSTFRLCLPLAADGDGDAQAEAAASESRSASPVPTSSPPPSMAEPSPAPTAAAVSRRILVADDNRDAADTLALLLELDGHQVQVAYHGGDALRLFASFRPELVLLDLDMPVHGGAEVAAMIRRDDTATPLIAVSGFGQARDRRMALAAGFTEHLTKPVDLDALQRLVDSLAPRP